MHVHVCIKIENTNDHIIPSCKSRNRYNLHKKADLINNLITFNNITDQQSQPFNHESCRFIPTYIHITYKMHYIYIYTLHILHINSYTLHVLHIYTYHMHNI